MNGAWPDEPSGLDPALVARRSAHVRDALVERSKPGTYSYGIVVALYGVAIYTDRASLFAAAIAVTLLMLVGAARAWSYRVPSFRNDLSRWRWSFCVGAFSCMLIFDSFVAFELWHRAFDPAAMVILAASLAIRASVANVLAPDRWVSQVFARFSRPPVFIACIAMWSPVSLVLLVLLLVHTIYLEMSGNQLNAAYWRGIAASEAVERANASLRAEVVMRERAEIELRLAQKLESVGRLAAGIAHEMNSPLQAMVNSVHFAEEATNDLLVIAQRIRDKGTLDAKSAADVDYLGANLPDAMAILRESLERTASIVKSVKTFAQPSATERSPVDLNKAVATTLDISRHEYAEFADVKLELGELPMVQCFAGELNQALLNIVINAAQAIEDRGATQRGLITVRTESTGGDVRIAISDTGGGIPSEIRDRIFDPFFTTKPIGKGTGQGLAIARSVITTRHGGELSFTSEVGRGTTFVIQLPARA